MSVLIDSAESLASVCKDTWIRHTEFQPSHASTNDRALQLVGSGDDQPLPMLVYAQRQTAGRGRGENVWWATDGALTFSLLLDPTDRSFPAFPADRWGTLSLATAMAVGRTLLAFAPAADVAWKWPNDVFVEGRKICGILLEVPSSKPPRMVIGIGMNVNNPMDEIAEHDGRLRDTAISLSSVLGEAVDLGGVLRQFLTDFEDVVLELQRDPLHLSQLWNARDFLRDREVTLEVGAQSITGTAVGVGGTGALLIEGFSGKVQSFPGGVITRFS